MLSKFNKIISILLTIIFISGIIPPVLFADPNPTHLGEVKGFNRAVIDSHFSRADRELNPERWLEEAKFGVTQAICAWELIAGNLYENPLLYEEAKAQIVKWSDEELEKRFSQWLMGRFFGKAAEEALLNLSSMFNKSQKYYSWHLDEEGNVIFDDKTGDPLVIRPNEEGREFSHDLELWRNETDDIVKTTSSSFNNVINNLYPELLAYIPVESRESIIPIINETLNIQSNVIKLEFENIAAREERIFTNRRTRDIWSLRKKSDDEAAKKFTEKLIAETDETCKRGIEELNAKIEQASAGVGDLALLGEEWLRLYKEQFERGLKAWEDAEERFFIRRIEWEQESFKLFSEGEAVWLSAFNQFEEERQKWEINAQELFQAGESLFNSISEDFEKTIADAKKEFELNAAIRIGEGTNKVKALIDIYLVFSSATISLMDNVRFWQRQYGNGEKDIRDSDFPDWVLQETVNLWKQTESAYLNDPDYISDLKKLEELKELSNSIFSPILNRLLYGGVNYSQFLIEFNEKYSKLFQLQDFLKGEMTLSEQIAFAKNMDTKYFPKFKFEALLEMLDLYNMYPLYAKKSLDARNSIYENYAELFGTGALKDILSSDVSSDDFYLDEYQIALIRAKALVLYWERKTSIADAVMAYAEESGAERMTEAEGIRAWEEAKAAYNISLAAYEIELGKLNELGEDIQKQQAVLNKMTEQMQEEEEKLNNLYSDYSSLVSMSASNMESYYFLDFNEKYNNLVEKYKKYEKTGADSIYFSALEYGLLWEIAEQREIKEIIINILETNNELLAEDITRLNNNLIALSTAFQNELWENACNSLSLLLGDYGLITETNLLPDAQSICYAIFDRPGDFAENTAKFLTDFDNCFSATHTWLKYEIDNWKKAIIEYITTFAFFYNIQPEKDAAELAGLYDDLMAEYIDFYQYAVAYDYDAADDDLIEQMNNAFMNISNKVRMFDYISKISETWESMKAIASTGNETHWRQYLLNEYITNKDSSLVMVSSWTSGILADAFYYASYYTNRINDSFNIYSQKNSYNTDKDAEQLYYLYSGEINQILFNFNTLNSQFGEIANAAKLLGFAKLSPNDLKNQLSVTDRMIEKQELTVNILRSEYFIEANKFLDIGSQYDNQYNILKIAYNDTDQKRFEYEKQDAIQRWASTSYINTDNIDPASCRANLLKAQTVLNVLSDISDNNNKSSYSNPEYEALYAAYEQSFSNNIKVLEAIEMLSSSYLQEKMNNANIHHQYQNSLFQLGINFNYKDYNLPESEKEWKIENIITINNGRLAFSRDESMKIIGVNLTEATPVMDFFNKTESVNGEYIDITGYEEALRGLSQRMSEYFKDQNKPKQWSYAKNYLLLSLTNANKDLDILNNYLSVKGELSDGGSLASEYINLNDLGKNITLSSYMEDKYFKNNYALFQNEWNKLSAEEKADLEFYVILTLTAGNNYFSGFNDMYAYEAYLYAEKKVYSLYKEADDIVDTWLVNPIWYLWLEPRDLNKNTYNRIVTVRQETANNITKWTNGLENNLSSINNLSALYASSCKMLDEIEGTKTEGSKIVWGDLESALLNTKMKSEDIAAIKNYWETMQKNSANTTYTNVFEAFLALSNWTNNEVYYAKNNLETRFYTDINNQQLNEEAFSSVVDDYFNGKADINAVKTAANNAYGKNTVPVKYYFDNMYNVSINNLSMYMTTEFNFNELFNGVEEEIISLAANTIMNKYNAEYLAREAEWELMRKDIEEKYNEWQNTAAQILENGRTDWTESYKKLENAYKQWHSNFQSEYERVNNEWVYAYLAGLEDKEEWLRQAADAANQASSESFLSLIGTEGERLSRFIDTREPLGIRDAVPEVQSLMANLLQSSGIVNMASAFNSLNNFTNITSPLVKRGMGGASSWDSALVKIAALDMVKKTNAEIANVESRKLAYSVRASADEAIKSLTAAVNAANQSFRESMDNIFIVKGLWRRNGNDYIKDIIKGSTIFTPVISKTVTVSGYKNYIMEPVILKTNLEENYLAGLDTIAVQGLIDNIYVEVQAIAGEIFGNDEEKNIIKINAVEKENPFVLLMKRFGIFQEQFPEKTETYNEIVREQSPGKFGTHIGYKPAEKKLESATTERNEMFYDEGAGELGRLLSDFHYWLIIDRIGNAELSVAPWDKRMWDDEGSWFHAPNLRTIGAIVGTIVAAACTYGVGGFVGIALSVGIASASEITLGALDVAYEYKPLDEVAVSVGKTVLINTATSLIGGAFNGIKDTGIIGLTETAMGNAAISPANKVLANTLITGTQTITTGFVTSAISGITYNSEYGFGYSGEIFAASMKGTLTSSLTSMAGVFTTTGLKAINSGLDLEKLEGFNKLNKSNLENLNGLIGSLVGQGVNYALGNDFTLNLLNLSLLTNNKLNNGLLELHLGHDGVSMSVGTGGANVSIDNLIAAYRGIQVWDVNTKISNYGEEENFNALIALRAQYGYGDDVQKDQLWDILNGNTIINTNAEGDYVAETTINNDGKRVINLAAYEKGMSKEEQYLLATVLGYEAYRDGYTVGQIDASGEKVTYTAQFDEFKNAHIAKLLMGDRIYEENKWFYEKFEGLLQESVLFGLSKLTGDFSDFDDYLELAYDNSKDYLCIPTATRNDYQNYYTKVNLFDSVYKFQETAVDERRLQAAFEKYIKKEHPFAEGNEYQALYYTFLKDKKLQKEYGYRAISTTTISDAGCMFMSTKYAIEAITGKEVSTLVLHQFIKDNRFFADDNMLSRWLMAQIMTAYSNNDFNVTYMEQFGEAPTNNILNKIESPDKQYLIHLRVKDPSKTNPIIHSVMVSSIEYTYDDDDNISGIKQVNVANPYKNDNHFNGKSFYLPNEIDRWDFFLVTKNKK